MQPNTKGPSSFPSVCTVCLIPHVSRLSPVGMEWCLGVVGSSVYPTTSHPLLPHPPLSLGKTKLPITPLGAIMVRATELTYWFLTLFLFSPHQVVWLWRWAGTGHLISLTGRLFCAPQPTAIHLSNKQSKVYSNSENADVKTQKQEPDTVLSHTKIGQYIS